VPITVYQPKGDTKFHILDGERRYRCCLQLEAEGVTDIPANIVAPPDKMASLVYMFAIHSLREPWELMPTALSLKTLMDSLGHTDDRELHRITGLSLPEITRCKALLTLPPEFQNLSLDEDPTIRVPSNFWIEALPLVDIVETSLPEFAAHQGGRSGLLRLLLGKYRQGAIRNIIHLRRAVEACRAVDGERERLMETVRSYFTDIALETRKAFDPFIEDTRRVEGGRRACDSFLQQLRRLNLEYAVEREQLTVALQEVRNYVDDLIQRLDAAQDPSTETSGALDG
jgi:hypothetical protein